MADQIILVDASVEVDDVAWTLVGNTLSFTEGLGESSITAATQGGVPVMCISQDVATKVAMIKFEVPASPQMMNATRETHALGSGRLIRISGSTPDGNRMGRTFRSAIITNEPEKSIQNEGTIPVEFKSAPAVPS